MADSTTCNPTPKLNHYNHLLFWLDHCRDDPGLWPVSRKSRELFGPEKPFVKLRPAYSVKLVFSYVVKGIKIKIQSNLDYPDSSGPQ